MNTDFQRDAKGKDENEELLKNKLITHSWQWDFDMQPIIAGEHFVIARSWEQEIEKQCKGRKIIRIDPGSSYDLPQESIFLSLEFLEEYWKGGRLLNAYVGTGVIAIAAALLSPTLTKSLINICDVCIDALEDACQNFEINSLPEQVRFEQIDISKLPSNYYDIIVVNPVNNLVSVNKDLIRSLKPKGKLFFSEPLQTRESESFFDRSGWHMVKKKQIGKWLGFIVEKTSY